MLLKVVEFKKAIEEVVVVDHAFSPCWLVLHEGTLNCQELLTDLLNLLRVAHREQPLLYHAINLHPVLDVLLEFKCTEHFPYVSLSEGLHAYVLDEESSSGAERRRAAFGQHTLIAVSPLVKKNISEMDQTIRPL